jgi:hypothetical protein
MSTTPTQTDAMAIRATGLSIDAEAPATGTRAGPRKFAMNAYNGGPLDLTGWRFPVVIDLAGLDGTDKTRPIFFSHDPARIVGHTTSMQVTPEGSTAGITVEGLISGAGDAAREVLAAHDNGFPWQASVGARAKQVEFIPEGKTASANGRTFSGPLNIARRSVLGEISFVPLGADDSTSARIAATSAEGTVPMSTTPTTPPVTPAVPPVTAAAPVTPALPNPDDGVAEYRKRIAAEASRVAAVQKICDGKHATLEAQAIAEGWDVSKTELEVLRAARPTHKVYINTGVGQDITAQAITAAACLSVGIGEKAALFGLDDATKQLVAGRKLRGIGLHEILAHVAMGQGVHFRPGRVDDDFIRALFQSEQQMNIRAADATGVSTLSLSGILENVMNKAMLEGYGLIASVIGDIAFETDTNDFKQFKRYRLTASGKVQPVGPDGELKSISLQDESYANQVKTVGTVITVTRQMIINDDLGALTQIPTVLGRQCALSRERAVFTTLLGNAGSFFAAGNNNYLTGATSALSISSLTLAKQRFLEQTDINKDPILLLPDRVLVPPALSVTADKLYKDTTVIGTGVPTSAKAVEGNSNPHAGSFRPVVSPYLSTRAGLLNASDTGWYVLTNPAGGMAVIQIGYLRGQRAPTIERGELDFNHLGIGMRAFYDFGVAQHDFRTGVFAAGA